MEHDSRIECPHCEGSGEYGVLGYCAPCKGTGHALCSFCSKAPATAADAVDPEVRVCAACAPLLAPDATCACGDTPIAMQDGVPLCPGCWDAARHAPSTLPPSDDRETLPYLPDEEPANDGTACEVVDEDAELRIRAMQATALLIEDCKAVGAEPVAVMRALRRAVGGGR